MSYRLDGRTALVTGATRGLGIEMARALGKAGAKVAMNYANSDVTPTPTPSLRRHSSRSVRTAAMRSFSEPM